MAYNPYMSKLNELKKQMEGEAPASPVEKPASPAQPVAPKAAAPQSAPAAPPRYPASPPPGNRPGGFVPAASADLPKGYLEQGYFDAEGHIHKALLVEHASAVAKAIGLRQERAEGIKNAQLRKFYGHVKTAESRMNYGVSFEAVQPKILELSAFVAEAQGKGKVPPVFKSFIDMNLSYVVDGKSFREGFVKHFQAVVGFFSFYYKE